MSDITRAIYASQDTIKEEVEKSIDHAVTRVEAAIFASIKALWDENEPVDLSMEGHDYWSAYGARGVLAQLAKDFDLLEDLVNHDESASRHA